MLDTYSPGSFAVLYRKFHEKKTEKFTTEDYSKKTVFVWFFKKSQRKIKWKDHDKNTLTHRSQTRDRAILTSFWAVPRTVRNAASKKCNIIGWEAPNQKKRKSQWCETKDTSWKLENCDLLIESMTWFIYRFSGSSKGGVCEIRSSRKIPGAPQWDELPQT